MAGADCGARYVLLIEEMVFLSRFAISNKRNDSDWVGLLIQICSEALIEPCLSRCKPTGR